MHSFEYLSFQFFIKFGQVTNLVFLFFNISSEFSYSLARSTKTC